MKPVESSKRGKTIAYEVSSPSVDESSVTSQQEWEGQPEEGSLEKVRDILFGAQSREFQKRFTLLENRLLQESTDLKLELTQTLEDLKSQVNQEVSRLTTQIDEEKGQRGNSLQEVSQVIQNLGTQLETRLSGLNDQTTTQYHTLEGQLNQQRKEMSEHHEQTMDRLQREFQQGFQELKADKTDRAVLADMLMQLAVRLKGEPMD